MDWIKLDRSKAKAKPLVWQLTDSLRDAVKMGRLRAGHKLPSSRMLAEQLNLSRNIVILAFEQLAIEGYLEAKAGSGNYVASGAAWRGQSKEQRVESSEQSEESNPIRTRKSLIDFRAGTPALEEFPRRVWARLTSDVCREISGFELGYSNPAGCLSLRAALGRHLSLYRGVQCSVEQIVITSGAAQAFDILAKIFASSVKEMIVEDPMTIPIYENFIRLGLHVEPIEVDDQGMRTDLLPNNKRPRGIFVTPSHQFPLGGILPVQRRIELIRFTQESGSYIIEDDYDSEFRHQGSPLPALQELAPDRVVYVGTFSKMLFPGLRLGYVVLPPTLIEEFVGRKRIHDLGCPTVDQLTLARFIDEGHLQRHILQMKKLYAKRRLTLIRSLAKAFGDKVRILGDATGMHLIADFLKLRFSPKEVERFRSGGVRVYPVEEYAIVHGRHANRLVFGYGNLSPEQIERGVSRLAQLLNKI